MPDSTLSLNCAVSVQACNAGLFVSRGRGKHVERTIDSFVLIFVRNGELGMHENGRHFDLHAGQTLLLWPGRTHGGTRPYPRNLSFYWIHFELRTGRKGARKPNLRVPQFATARREDRMVELFRRFLDDQESGLLEPLPAALLITEMLCEVAASAERGTPPATATAALAARAEQYVRAHFHMPVGTSDIARELDCNPDYLGRIFQRTYGYTIVDAIHQQRIRTARRLLMESALNIDQIAQECGFGDSHYFRRIFRRSQGISPRAFRRLYARAHVNAV
jgi:AraC-like DNA-binding protein